MMSRPARCVVEHILCLSVTIRIEHLPDMGQAVPLGGVLQGHDDLVSHTISVAVGSHRPQDRVPQGFSLSPAASAERSGMP
jgi:hypothetical protein